MNKVVKYEHQKLLIGEKSFKEKHWKSFIKLNSLHGNKYFKILHNGVQFNQYVGILQIDNFSVEIHPKADKHQDDDKWRNVLLPMLKACGKISPKSVGSANVGRQNLNLLDVYFDLFLNEVDKLIRQGLIKKYRRQTKNVNALKGKLEFAGHLKQNLVHKERFYTTHQVYDKNHLLHQIIKYALVIIKEVSNTSFITSRVNTTLFSLPEISDKTITEATFNNLILDRKSKPYSYAIELARLIILNYSPAIKHGKNKIISLLFDMNNLWEEFILIQLRSYVNEFENDWEVIGQDSKPFIGSHSLKPDIVLKNKYSNETIVIDTKWKLGQDYISIQDLRQVYTYARFWDAEKVVLLYPGDNSPTKFKRFESKDFSESQNLTKEITHLCKLSFLKIFDSESKLNENLGDIIFKLLMEKTT